MHLHPQLEAERKEKEAKRRAYDEEMKRRRMAEEHRRETEAILAAQAEEVRLKKMEMDKRDQERAKRMAEETKQRELSNMEKRKKADLRIQSELGGGGVGIGVGMCGMGSRVSAERGW